ncbi:AGAP005670-PA-like protein [Anopheles sinensis]|uniref:AGAP005670-PA-like protein n=1 Tax=Anopheles sinensis TaxID=74873 RepID=A0A084W490_ANOSI|nr:AGAP005670-PA-like protein [Anopheles sinensis]
MKTFALLVGLLAVASAEWIDIDWSKVRPIEDFDHYWARLPAELQVYRHMRPSARIVNGQEAIPGQFPYQIALLSEFLTGTGLCGGSVLTNNYILTAAHCVVSGATTLATGGTAIIGAHNRNVQEPEQQRIRFSTAGIIIMTNADCIAQWNTVLIQPQNVCMSGANGRSACNGDSGGPLAVQDDGSLQIGIVSFGSAAGCSIGMPSVYARVSFFLDFIEANSDFVASA